MKDNEYLNAVITLDNIIKSLKKDNRFFIDDSDVLDLTEALKTTEKVIEKHHPFFRARNFDEKVYEKNPGNDPNFQGYNKEDSYVKKDVSWEDFGRMNPRGTKVLYASSDYKTAIREIHPYYDQIINIGYIRNMAKLRIADLSQGIGRGRTFYHSFISNIIQECVSEGNTEKEYIFPQFIASLCKKLGFDGVAFRSKYATKSSVKKGEGINYVIFDIDKCEPMASKLYRVKRVVVEDEEYFI